MRAGLVALALFATPAISQDGLGGMLPKMPPPAADAVDPIGDAVKGLVAEIEDDKGSGSFLLARTETTRCVTRFIGADKSISIDWNKPNVVGPGDTFVFLSGEGVQFAIVGDASKLDQAQKLGSLLAAAQAMSERCQGTNSPE